MPCCLHLGPGRLHPGWHLWTHPRHPFHENHLWFHWSPPAAHSTKRPWSCLGIGCLRRSKIRGSKNQAIWVHNHDTLVTSTLKTKLKSCTNIAGQLLEEPCLLRSNCDWSELRPGGENPLVFVGSRSSARRTPGTCWFLGRQGLPPGFPASLSSNHLTFYVWGSGA